jgi:S1-C subfamily serine protease
MNDSKSDLGMPILNILPGSPAARAGAKVGDRVISVDGVTIGSAVDFIRATENRGPVFQVEVMRSGQIIAMTFDVTTPAIAPGADPEEIIRLFQDAEDPSPSPDTLN